MGDLLLDLVKLFQVLLVLRPSLDALEVATARPPLVDEVCQSKRRQDGENDPALL